MTDTTETTQSIMVSAHVSCDTPSQAAHAAEVLARAVTALALDGAMASVNICLIADEDDE